MMRFTILFAALASVVVSNPMPCTTPPAFWCSNEEISKECGVTDQCNQYKGATMDKKVNITMLFESLCPGCRQFITTQLYPVYQHYKEIMNVELVPWGNAQIQDGKVVCQHGEEECVENILDGCAIKYLKPLGRDFDYIYCIEMESGKGKDPKTSAEFCFKQWNITSSDQNKINTCWKGDEGKKIQMAMGTRTNMIMPEKHEFVPWFMVNDRSLMDMQNYQVAFEQMICEWYNGPKKSQYCQQMRDWAGKPDAPMDLSKKSGFTQ